MRESACLYVLILLINKCLRLCENKHVIDAPNCKNFYAKNIKNKCSVQM